MPTTIQWYVRTALLYLFASAALGVLYQLDLWLRPFGFTAYVIVIHTHLALMGGVVQMIMGVALWMFPLTQPIETRLPFREGLAWSAYALFNGGLLGRFVVESIFRTQAEGVTRNWAGGLTVLTGLMQLVAMGLFIWHLWSLRTSRRDRLRKQNEG